MPQHIVHVENVSNHSAYKHLFVYRGSSLSELMAEFHTFYPYSPKITYELYNGRFGNTSRKRLTDEVLSDDDEYLYVFLRINKE